MHPHPANVLTLLGKFSYSQMQHFQVNKHDFSNLGYCLLWRPWTTATSTQHQECSSIRLQPHRNTTAILNTLSSSTSKYLQSCWWKKAHVQVWIHKGAALRRGRACRAHSRYIPGLWWSHPIHLIRSFLYFHWLVARFRRTTWTGCQSITHTTPS